MQTIIHPSEQFSQHQGLSQLQNPPHLSPESHQPSPGQLGEIIPTASDQPHGLRPADRAH